MIPSRRAGPVPGRGTRGRARAPLRGSRTGWTAARGSPKPCRTPQGIPEAGDLIEIGPCLIGEVPLADLLRRRRRLPGDSHRPVVLLHIEPERLRVSRPRPPARADRHDASASQDRGRLSVARAGVDPVQRVEHRHRANRDGAGVPPVLERGRDDADEREPGGPGSRPVRQGRAQFHRRDRKPPLGQRHRRLPGPAADLDDPVALPEAGRLEQVVEQGARQYRPGPVVSLGIGVEPAAQFSPRAVLRHWRVGRLIHESRIRPSAAGRATELPGSRGAPGVRGRRRQADGALAFSRMAPA